jgi:polyhydroxyalkanoate synthesis regulator phasin
MSLVDIAHKALMAGLGMQTMVKDFVDDLVQKGELNESQGARLIKEWSDKAGSSKEEFDKNLKEFVERAVEKINFPTRKEVEEIKETVQALSSRLRILEESSSAQEKPGKS